LTVARSEARPSPPPSSSSGSRGRAPASGSREGAALGALAAGSLGLASIALDLARRAEVLVRWGHAHRLAYLAFALYSLVLSSALVTAAAARRGRARLAALPLLGAYLWALSVAHAFRSRWSAYPSRDSLENVEDPWLALTACAEPSSIVPWALGLSLLGLASVRLSQRAREPSPRGAALALALGALLLGLSFVLPVSFRQFQSTTPELVFASGLGARWRNLASPTRRSGMQARTPDPLPALEARPARPRNVLFVLQESQRADETCVAFDPVCPLATPATNALLPERLPMLEARAQASSTLVSMLVLFTGLAPTASRSDVHRAPMLWEYARAAGVRTAYFSTQHFMFSNMHMFLRELEGPLVTATHVDPLGDLWAGPPDARLVDRFEAELASLEEPFLVVLHSANPHAPRVYDPTRAPFQPSADDKSRPEAYRNFYRNVVYLSDLAIARAIASLRATDKGRRTVVLYTADHGEGYSEHAQGCDHACTVFDEEVRVPLFVDAPRGTLTDAERASLGAARDRPVFHQDVLPTLLDLIGVWDAPALEAPRARMRGRPLTRGEPGLEPVALSNVAQTWEFPEPSWGVFARGKKLAAHYGSTSYQCFDLLADPEERAPLEGGCPELEREAEALYGGVLPREFPGLLRAPRWGRAAAAR
jgi:glucan phosphoethanolaminetransferase (alkaline phosphatase superfamily)